MTRGAPDAIKARYEKAVKSPSLNYAWESWKDMPALIAEVERLERERDAAVKDFTEHGRVDYEYQQLCRFCIGEEDCCHIEHARKRGWRLPQSCEDFTWHGAREAEC